MLTSCNFNNVVSFVWVQVFDSCWLAAVEFVADTKLTMVVETPSKQLVLIVDVKAVHVSTEDIDGVLGSYLLDLEGLVVLVPCVQHSADLAGLAISPSVDLAALSQGQGVLGTTCNLLDTQFAMLREKLSPYHDGFDLLFRGFSRLCIL